MIPHPVTVVVSPPGGYPRKFQVQWTETRARGITSAFKILVVVEPVLPHNFPTTVRLPNLDVNFLDSVHGKEKLIGGGVGLTISISIARRPPQVLPILTARKQELNLGIKIPTAARILNFIGVNGARVRHITRSIVYLILNSIRNTNLITVNISNLGQNPFVVELSVIIIVRAVFPKIPLGLEGIGSPVGIGNLKILGEEIVLGLFVFKGRVNTVLNFQKTSGIGVPLSRLPIPLAIFL